MKLLVKEAISQPFRRRRHLISNLLGLFYYGKGRLYYLLLLAELLNDKLLLKSQDLPPIYYVSFFILHHLALITSRVAIYYILQELSIFFLLIDPLI